MKMKITAAAVIAAAAVMLAGCGSDSSSKADTSAAAPAAQSQADTAASQAEESTAPAAEESKAEESQADAPAASAFTADNAAVKYNGAEIKVGQNIDDVKGSLGTEAAPASQAPSCLSGNTINEYYYPGMTIQANTSGVIFSIELTNALYAGGDGTTADGLKVGDKIDDFKAKLGEPTETKGTSPVYTAGTVSMQASGSPSGVESIWISDSSIDN